MARPIFHEGTSAAIAAMTTQTPHAIGLYGDHGIGLQTVARQVIDALGATPTYIVPEKDSKPDRAGGSISIEAIRQLYEATRTKTRTWRCIVIVDADTMSVAAQNAFLKLLEEPTPWTCFLLLTHHSDALLPTIRSRLQLYPVRPITDEQSLLLLDRLLITDPARRGQLMFLGSGRPALLTRLATDTTFFEHQVARLQQARTYLQGSLYDRLRVSHELRSARSDAEAMLTYAMLLLRFDITKKQTADSAMLRLIDGLDQALIRLRDNGNVRLVLARAAVSQINL